MRSQTLKTFLEHKSLTVSAFIAVSIFLSALFLTQEQTSLQALGKTAAPASTVTVTAADGGNFPYGAPSYVQDNSLAASSTDISEAKKDFFAASLAQGSHAIKQETVDDLVQHIDTKALTPQKEIVDLTISSDNSPASIKTYINAFGVLIKKYSNQKMDQSEDTVIKNALAKKDLNTQIELQLFAVMYKNFSKDLLALSVPSSLAKAHLLIVNGYEGMGDGLLGLTKMQSDPINGTASYEAYTKYRLDVTNGYAFIVKDVITQHITFTADEPGYPFYWNTVTTKAPVTK